MNLLSFLFPQILGIFNSPLNGEIKITEHFGKRTLWVNDAEQSGGTITGMWNRSISNLRPACRQGRSQISNLQNCLVLGLGGGTAIELLYKYYPESSIDAIEFDPVMIDIAEKYFGVKSSDKLKIIHADAFTWIKKIKKKYDLVIFDLYIGKFNPEKSRKLPFLKDLKNLLSRSGTILFNAHYQNDEGEHRRLLRDSQSVFHKVDLLLSRPYSRILLLR